MERKIKKLVQDLKTLFNEKDMIFMIYSENNDVGIKEDDALFLNLLLKQTNMKNPLFFLHGHGGDFIPAILIPRFLEKKVNSYKVFIPSVCSSALCYLIFKANELIVTDKTRITQIDPKFPYKGQELRAILHTHSSDEDLKREAREVWDLAEYHIRELIKSPSIFNYKKFDSGEFEHFNLIVEYFMNKNEHEKEITYDELKAIDINITKNTDIDKKRVSKELIKESQEFMKQKEVRVIFLSSSPFLIEGEIDEGIYICPLK